MGMGKGLPGAANEVYGDHDPPILDDWASRCQVKYVTDFLPVGKKILTKRSFLGLNDIMPVGGRLV
jgi:hypothetical protein